MFPIGTLIALVTLAEVYKSWGADELRTQVYQPLFADVAAWKQSVDTLGVDEPATTAALTALQQSGAFDRIPESLRTEILTLSEEAQRIHAAALEVDEIARRDMAGRLPALRTEESDRVWRETASIKLATEADGPTFVVRDWIDYPDSLAPIEKRWTELDYLYFDNRPTEVWYYRITREDLTHSGQSSLKVFLVPTYQLLQANSHFQFIRAARPRLLADIAALEGQLTSRMQTPKQLRDLIIR